MWIIWSYLINDSKLNPLTPRVSQRDIKVVLTFESADEILKCDIQMNATEQYFPVVLFIMLYKVILTFESADEILQCDHSNETSSAVLSHGTIYIYVFNKIKLLIKVEVWMFGSVGSERVKIHFTL